jgi:hypothetical protein
MPVFLRFLILTTPLPFWQESGIVRMYLYDSHLSSVLEFGGTPCGDIIGLHVE